MIELLVSLVIAGVVYWALQQLLFPYIAEPFRNVIRVLIIVIVVIWAVRLLATLI